MILKDVIKLCSELLNGGPAEIVRALDNVNIVDEKGDTPLHVAVKYKRVDLVVILLKHGGKWELDNSEAKKAFEYANTDELRELKSLLSQRTVYSSLTDDVAVFKSIVVPRLHECKPAILHAVLEAKDSLGNSAVQSCVVNGKEAEVKILTELLVANCFRVNFEWPDIQVVKQLFAELMIEFECYQSIVTSEVYNFIVSSERLLYRAFSFCMSFSGLKLQLKNDFLQHILKVIDAFAADSKAAKQSDLGSRFIGDTWRGLLEEDFDRYSEAIKNIIHDAIIMPVKTMIGIIATRRMLDAARENKTTDFQQCLEEDPLMLYTTAHAVDLCGLTVLHHAAIWNNCHIIKALLSKIPAGPDTIALLKSVNSYETPLHAATRMGKIEALDILLRASENSLIDSQDRAGYSLAFIAASQGKVEVLKFLWDRGASLGVLSANGESVLHAAAMSADSQTVFDVIRECNEKKSVILSDFVSIKSTNNGTTAFHLACNSGNISAIKLLLQSGSCYNEIDAHGKHPRDHISKKTSAVESLFYELDRLFYDAWNKDGSTLIEYISKMQFSERMLVGHAKQYSIVLKRSLTLVEVLEERGHKHNARELYCLIPAVENAST